VSKLPKNAQALLVAVVFLAALLLSLYPQDFPWEIWPELLLFLVLIAFASMFPIPDPRGGYITAASVLFSVLIVVHGPWPGLLVAGPAYAVGAAISRRWLPWRTVFNGAQMGISVWLAGLTFVLTGGNIAQLEIRSAVIPLAAAILVQQTANNFFISFYFSRVRRTPWFSTWISDIRSFILPNFLSIPVVLLLAYVYVTLDPLAILLYLVALPFQRRANELQIKQRQIFDQAIDALVVAVDAGFPQGAGHSRLVANTSVALARHLGLSDAQVDTIELASLLHDVGLLGLDELLSDAKVVDDESAGALRQHVIIGAEISRELPQRGIAEIVLHHHERFDGTGYPRGLAGKQIPIGARIVALAEAFESMRAGGFPYGEPVPTSNAKEAILAGANAAFDPQVVEAFVSALEVGAITDHESGRISSPTRLSEQVGHS
jgi:hypothetical protein